METENARLTELTTAQTETTQTAFQTDQTETKRLAGLLQDSQKATTKYLLDITTKQKEIDALTSAQKIDHRKIKTLQDHVDLLQPLEDARLKAENAEIDANFLRAEAQDKGSWSQRSMSPAGQQHCRDEYYRVHPELRPANYKTPEERRAERRGTETAE